MNTNWPVFWSEYIEIWENKYYHIPDLESIIVPELAGTPNYMPWFRIHVKLYLLSEEQRRRQIYVERERRGLLNPRRRDESTHTIIGPINNAHTITGPNASTDDTHITTFSDYTNPMPGWNAWSGASPFSMTPTQPMIYRPSSLQGSHEAPSASLSHYHFPSPFGIQTPPSRVMKTPPHFFILPM
ncbi:hypothetical protein PVK06_034538 [Gossypium arboreum]|uniref:Uncharacterized protein n=1 Tax=Gossypium arboreum TaxID=29729 RepID=A0ABR0NF18_GOSAR|nr:hypothetical protein PVK06_034538 [Gossypium arboreum]